MGGYRFRDIVGAFWRRLWILAVAVVLLTPLAVAVAFLLPAKFEATARILIEAQQIPTALARPTVTATALERVQRIRQELMTRDVIAALIGETGLYAGRPDLSLTDKVDLVRAAVVIQNMTVQPDKRSPVTLAAFTITFTTERAKAAADVANAFADRFVAANAETRSSQTAETLAFFNRTVAELGERLAAKEAELALFQQDNRLALPAAVAQNLQTIQALETQEKADERTLLGLREQKRVLEEGLRLGATAQGQPQSPEQQALQALKNQLAQNALLAPSHPTIVRLRAQIATLEAQVAAAASGTGTAPKSLAVLQTESQIRTLDRQIADTEEQIADSAKRRAELETAVARSTEVGATFTRLTREQGELQGQYQAAVAKRNQAQEGATLEGTQQGERFDVAERAREPEEPISPKRLLIAAGGAFASVLLGLGLMALAEMADGTIRSAHALEARTGLRPVVSIPYIMTRGERRFRRLRWSAFVLLFLVGLPAGLWAVDTWYLPLEVIAGDIAARTGLDDLIRRIGARLG